MIESTKIVALTVELNGRATVGELLAVLNQLPPEARIEALSQWSDSAQVITLHYWNNSTEGPKLAVKVWQR